MGSLPLKVVASIKTSGWGRLPPNEVATDGFRKVINKKELEETRL